MRLLQKKQKKKKKKNMLLARHSLEWDGYPFLMENIYFLMDALFLTTVYIIKCQGIYIYFRALFDLQSRCVQAQFYTPIAEA